MFCPRCGADASPGAQRCANCGAPFTMSARRAAAPRVAPRPSGAATYRTYQRGTGVGRAVIAWLAVLFLAAIAVLALITVFSSSVVKPYVGRQIEQSFAQPTVTATTAPAQTPAAAAAASSSGGRHVVITEQQLNQQIAEHQDQLSPLDSVTVQIQPDQLVMTMKSHGVSGTYRGHIEVQDGKPVLTGGKVDGLLGYVVPTAQLETVLNRQIDAAVAQSGVEVQSVALQQGQMAVSYA